MFTKKFEIIEIRESGVSVAYYLKGKAKDIKADIETFKKNSKKYEMVGKTGMVVWV